MATVDATPNSRSMPQETTTLTNWKRLTNTTNVFIVESAQALVWKGYIVIAVGSSPHTLHFYHLTHELWSNVSAVNSSYGGYLNMRPGCALITHGAKLLMLSLQGDVYELRGNKWIICPELKVKDKGSNYHAIFTSSSLGDDTLYSLILLESQDGQVLHTFRCFQPPQWSQPRKLQRSLYVFPSQYSQSGYQSSQYHYDDYQASFAAMKGSIYVSNGKQVYCIDLRNPEAETIPVVEIARLPLLQYTISSVNGTLFAFGGKDEDNQPSSDIYRYNSCSEIWEPAGYMRSARYGALVIPVAENGDTQVFVIGGNLGSTNKESLRSRVMESCEVHTR